MRIFVRTQFEGIHKYRDAPDEVEFLKYPHRHMFGVYIEMDVYHDDRELEFILVKRFVNTLLTNTDLQNLSCEQIGKAIKVSLIDEYGDRNIKVVIDEDGENGAII